MPRNGTLGNQRMAKVISSYYPPRARWYARTFDLGARVRRRLWLDRVRLPPVKSLAGCLGSIAIPGYGFYARGRRLWGELARAISTLSAAIFITELGRPLGNIAFGLIISIHAAGLAYFCEPLLVGVRFRFRVLCSVAFVAALYMLLYLPVRNVVEHHWLAPLQVNGKVMVVQKFRAAPTLQRGVLIAYTIHEGGDHQAGYVVGGLGVTPVLAVAGDRVRFEPDRFEVNGIPQARMATMPTSGELIVPEKHWFVWPELAMGGHGGPPAALDQLLLRLAIISEDQFAGRPFKRWFWHRQLKS
jgi:hypothetical protein